jgi:uncharacterized glyoxalase superfamily protein PhnB
MISSFRLERNQLRSEIMFKKAIPKFPVLDVKKAISFYKEKLGFEELFDYGDYSGLQLKQLHS